MSASLLNSPVPSQRGREEEDASTWTLLVRTDDDPGPVMAMRDNGRYIGAMWCVM